MTGPSMADVAAAAKAAVGFFEEAPGVKSSSRLFAAILLALAAAVVIGMDWYTWYQTVHGKAVDPLVIGAFVGALCPLVYQGAVAITKRTGVTTDPPGGAP
jgi:hypothetical protein